MNSFGIDLLKLEDYLPASPSIDILKTDELFSFYSDRVPVDVTRGYYPINALKKEFADLRVPSEEKIPNPPGPLIGQKFMSRFLSPRTTNDKILAFQGLGSGKSCLIAFVSQAVKTVDQTMERTLILTRGEILQKNFQNEIANVCLASKYAVDPNERDPKTKMLITDQQRQNRTKKNLEEDFEFQTFYQLAKELTTQSNDYIRRVYSRRVIGIDEVHNLRVKTPKSEKKKFEDAEKIKKGLKKERLDVNVYKQFWRMLHIVEGCKIILLSATPGKDRPIEIPELLNLILPENNQFDIPSFMTDYFDGDIMKHEKRIEFKEKIRGLISYVRSMSSDVKRIFEGHIIPPMRKISLVAVQMSQHQLDAYLPIWNKEKVVDPNTVSDEVEELDEIINNFDEEEKETYEKKKDEIKKTKKNTDSVYTGSRRSSMFVFPNGKYGIDEEKKWLRDNGSSVEISNDLKKFLNNGKKDASFDEKLSQLQILSVKFAGIIREIFENPKEKVFVYSNIVEGCGAVLFAGILQFFGMTHAKIASAGKRGSGVKASPFNLEDYRIPNQYILLKSKRLTAIQSDLLINKVFSNPANLYGDYIRVVIGTKVVGEGSSFKHTRQFHSLTPGWNNAEIEQAIGRGLRAGAHEVFPTQEEKYFKIFRWSAMVFAGNGMDSVDFMMYKLSEDKDFALKQLERPMKEAAVDCILNKDRNIQPFDVRNSRDCDYTKCSYSCVDVPREWYMSEIQDPIKDTYNLYYAEKEIEDVKIIVINLFHSRFKYDLYEFIDLLPEYSPIVIVRALKELIDQTTVFINRYNMQSFLHEDKNFYFLVDIPGYPNNHLLSYYSENPSIQENVTFRDWIIFSEYNQIVNRLEILAQADINNPIVRKAITNIVSTFSIELQEQLLESFLIAEKKNIDVNRELRTLLLEYFGDFIRIINGSEISPLLFGTTNRLRCLNQDEKNEYYWSDCSDELVSSFNNIKSSNREELKNNIYGFYGIIVPEGDSDSKISDLKIVYLKPEVRVTAKGVKDARQEKKENALFVGTVCGTSDKFGKGALISLFFDFYDIAKDIGGYPPSITLDSKKYKLTNITADKLHKSTKFKKYNHQWMKKTPKYRDEDVINFSDEKLAFVYSLVEYSDKNKLCEGLKQFFIKNKLIDHSPIVTIKDDKEIKQVTARKKK